VPEYPKLEPIAQQPVSVVLLACNVQGCLDSVLSGWVSYLNGLNREYEILLIDDGSKDDTPALSARLAERFRRVQVLRHPEPQGDGACLRTAFGQARHPLIFYTLCDPRYPPTQLNRMLVEPFPRPDGGPAGPLIDLVHLTTGFRAGQRVPVAWRMVGGIWRLFCRLLFSAEPAPLPGWLGWRRHLAQWLARLVFGVQNRDMTCPVRLLRRDILARIPLQSRGAFVHAEILAKANFLGHLVSEDVPLGDRFRPVPPEARPGTVAEMVGDAWRLYKRPDFGPVKVETVTAQAAP
jgi:glycosyltransferase involved in cell wall biosynthesis